MNIQFSETEMVKFLIKLGYNISEIHEHQQGSRQHIIKTIAEKNNTKLSLENAFEYELKNKILN